LSAARGHATSISSPESLTLTHALRAAHDGIMVGVGTVECDDPSLTVRLVSGDSPTPIIVDYCLRLPPASRMIALRRARGSAATIIVLHGKRCRDGCPRCGTETEWSGRAAALTAAGAILLECPARGLEGGDAGCGDTAAIPSGGSGAHHHMDLDAALGIVASAHAIKSVMVEGGAALLASWMSQSARVDAVVVTLAPIFLPGGVHIGSGNAAGAAASGANTRALAFESVAKVGADLVALLLPSRSAAAAPDEGALVA
jgi:GTP cyclohydrolase II